MEILIVTSNLRQFEFGLGRDYVPGDILFSPSDQPFDPEAHYTYVITSPESKKEPVGILTRNVRSSGFFAIASVVRVGK